MSHAWVGAHDCGSWHHDDSHGLVVDTGCGVDPPEVYIPLEKEWPYSVPDWAKDMRPLLIRDFEALGFRVVALPGLRLT